MDIQFNNITILYVEDDEIIRKSALLYLNKICKKVWGAENGIEALKSYEDYAPDIIISDIKMPKLNGLDMAKKIRRKDKTTPIILTTAFTDTSYLLEAVELQLIKYLIKPITSIKMLEALTLAHQYIFQNHNNVIPLAENTLYDSLNQTLVFEEQIISLTKKEKELLTLLLRYSDRIVSYGEIQKYIWFDTACTLDTLRSLVRSLRKKAKNIKIKNISGNGYKLIL